MEGRTFKVRPEVRPSLLNYLIAACIEDHQNRVPAAERCPRDPFGLEVCGGARQLAQRVHTWTPVDQPEIAGVLKPSSERRLAGSQASFTLPPLCSENARDVGYVVHFS